jgi:D-inositol-3-phosphate glycosyltransferase
MAVTGTGFERRSVSSGVDGGVSPGGGGVSVALLTGGGDKPYACGMAKALVEKGVRVDFVGSDEVECAELRGNGKLTFRNLRGSQIRGVSLVRRMSRVVWYYMRLIGYAWSAKPQLFHLLWNNKFETFDRTLLMLYYRAMGRSIVLTAHNVNAGTRDGNDSVVNRMTLRAQYRLADHIFVHTDKMKRALTETFRVMPERVSVVPFGINETVPNTALTAREAKRRLGIAEERTILLFGHIAPYKNVEGFLDAFRLLSARRDGYRLILAGAVKSGCGEYGRMVRSAVTQPDMAGRVIARMEYIPDDETEVYFKAADVLVLPYREVFQSGVLFLAYGFGLPVIAADVGSLRDDIVEGRTGFVSKSNDPQDLASAIETYFESDLFHELDRRRPEIREHARASNSWDLVGELTRRVYVRLLGGVRGNETGRQSGRSRRREQLTRSRPL